MNYLEMLKMTLQSDLGSSAMQLLEDQEAINPEIIGQAPPSDPKYGLVVGALWWLLHRRRRMEQQFQRRAHFNRRMRRLMFLRFQLQRDTLQGIASATQEALLSNLDDSPPPGKRGRMKNDTNSECFWNLFDNNELPSDVFLKNFHMKKDTFDFIYEKLEDHLRKSNTSMRESLPPKKRLAATLYRLANNDEYLKVGTLFGIGKSTVTSLVRDVCEIIVSILKEEFLNFHFDEKSISESFTKFGYPQLVGSIGTIDILILGSFLDSEELGQYSSKYFESPAVTFQAIVDNAGIFKYVSAGRPAGMSNEQILKDSSSCSQIQEKLTSLGNVVSVPAMVAGDDSYLDNFYWILSSTSATMNGLNFEKNTRKEINDKIYKAQSVFDEAVAKVKSRWKIFHGKNGKINFNADAFENIAMTCCILHNICEMREDPIDKSWSNNNDIKNSLLFVRRGIPEQDVEAVNDRNSDKSLNNDTVLNDKNIRPFRSSDDQMTST